MTTQVIQSLDQLAERPAGCVVTIGNFDGVHRGHQGILARSRALADEIGGRVVAVTFEPPPARVVAPQRAPEPLMHTAQRCRELGRAGADVVLVLQTTSELLQMSPEAFVRETLMARLGAAHVVEGRNFFFGHDRAGNVDTLAAFGRQLGFQVHVVAAVTVDLADESNLTVSSSLIRRLVREGKVQDASRCLGRPYTMEGTVVSGHGHGRKIAYPTANLDCGLQLLPADGAYAGWGVVGDRCLPAALSVGTRPTFGDFGRAVEAHLLGEVGELYGQTMGAQFVQYIRRQEKFESPVALVRQMDRDVQQIRQILEQ